MSVKAVDMMKFRSHVNQIDDKRNGNLIKTLYLTASREAEILTKTAPWDLKHESTKPYGAYLRVKIENYEIMPPKGDTPAVIEKALTITEAVAKRLKGKKKKRLQLEDLTPPEIVEYLPEKWRPKYLAEPDKFDPLLLRAFVGDMTYKIVALPCSLKYEPWTIDLLRYIQEHKTVSFDLTRQRIWQIYRDHLSPFLSPKGKRNQKNPLRHFRISHLLEHYNFDPIEITLYTGWSFKQTFGMMGMPASPNLDFYAHLGWKKYFPKLLRPIDQIR